MSRSPGDMQREHEQVSWTRPTRERGFGSHIHMCVKALEVRGDNLILEQLSLEKFNVLY